MRRRHMHSMEAGRRGIGRRLAAIRPFALGAVLLSIWPMADPALIDPVGLLATNPERVDEHFTRCGRGRGHACAIDGDTIKLGQRKVRIIGIDAPELTHPQCPEEARLAEAATVKMQDLLNRGAFEMVGSVTRDKDRYGRDLRALNRSYPDGTTISIAEEMRESGLAHRYLGGVKLGWC